VLQSPNGPAKGMSTEDRAWNLEILNGMQKDAGERYLALAKALHPAPNFAPGERPPLDCPGPWRIPMSPQHRHLFGLIAGASNPNRRNG